MLGLGVIPFWFVQTFIIIYSVLLLLHSFIKKHINLIVIVLGAICLVSDMASLYFIFFKEGYFIESGIPQQFRIWTWTFYFCLGYYINTTKKKIPLFVVLGASCLAIIYQNYVCNIFLGRINSEYCYNNVIIIVWCALIFAYVTNIKFVEKAKEIIAIISANSFGVFLLHVYFIQLFDLTNIISNSFESTIVWIMLIVVTYYLTKGLRKIPFIQRCFKW